MKPITKEQIQEAGFKPDEKTITAVNLEAERRAKHAFEAVKKSACGMNNFQPYISEDPQAGAILDRITELSPKNRNFDEEVASILKEAGFPKRTLDSQVNCSSSSGPWWGKCQDCAKILGVEGTTLAIIGENGCGKTQMSLKAIEIASKELFVKGKIPNCRYVTMMELLMEIKEAFIKDASRSERVVVKDFIKPKFLVIDECGKTSQTEWERNIFFHLVNKRYGEMKHTVLISNMPYNDFLDFIGNSLTDRICDGGAIVECNWESFRTNKPIKEVK